MRKIGDLLRSHLESATETNFDIPPIEYHYTHLCQHLMPELIIHVGSVAHAIGCADILSKQNMNTEIISLGGHSPLMGQYQKMIYQKNLSDFLTILSADTDTILKLLEKQNITPHMIVAHGDVGFYNPYDFLALSPRAVLVYYADSLAEMTVPMQYALDRNYLNLVVNQQSLIIATAERMADISAILAGRSLENMPPMVSLQEEKTFEEEASFENPILENDFEEEEVFEEEASFENYVLEDDFEEEEVFEEEASFETSVLEDDFEEKTFEKEASFENYVLEDDFEEKTFEEEASFETSVLEDDFEEKTFEEELSPQDEKSFNLPAMQELEESPLPSLSQLQEQSEKQTEKQSEKQTEKPTLGVSTEGLQLSEEEHQRLMERMQRRQQRVQELLQQTLQRASQNSGSMPKSAQPQQGTGT